MSESETPAADSSAELSKYQPQTPMWQENLYSLTGIALGMGIICFTSIHFQALFLIPSLASSAIMLFMSYNNVFAQPRNVVGGHLMSAAAAIAAAYFFGTEWWAITLVVVLASLLMLLTNTIHPPGGGTAIAAYLGGYPPLVLIGCVLIDTVIIVLVAFLVNNLISSRQYPRFWI